VLRFAICTYADGNPTRCSLAREILLRDLQTARAHIARTESGHQAMAIKPSDTTREIRAVQRVWIEKLASWTGLDPSIIATRAGLSGTTLTRPLNDEGYRGVLRPETIHRLVKEYKVPSPDEFARGALFPGEEAEPFDPRTVPADVARAVKALAAEHPGVEPWRLKGDVLIAVGYLPGDILLVDTTAVARAQDVVCAQAPNTDGSGPPLVTIWRVYDPPWLIGASPDRTAHKPLPVDGERVVVKGVICQMIRPQRLSAMK
jgi:hypothetical protein